jgi:glutamate-ammonia-ligase adenylyltransferase
MLSDQLLQTLTSRCPDADEEIVRDFVSRMDPDYFGRFDPDEIVHHIRLAARLDLDHPCQATIRQRPDGLYDVAIVAYDYFSEFATVCGLLSACGLDIREGSIYTFAEAPAHPGGRGRQSGMPRRRDSRRAGLARKKIVDVFRVRPLAGVPFTAERQRQLADALGNMVRLLDANRFQEARNLVNRRLVETLGRSRSAFTGLLQPVHIQFDNEQSPTDTVMDIRSVDTPAFLYAFSNALAMRGLYIHKARFENRGAELRDRFFVRGRHGQKLNSPAEQQELRLTAALIKQFTHFLTWAPDPGKAMDAFDRFLDRILEESRDGRALEFLKQKQTLTLLAQLLGTSDFLWEDFLRRQHANLLPVLEGFQRVALIRPRAELTRNLRRRLGRVRTEERRRQALNLFKDQEMFRIDMKHLLDPSTTLPEFSRALTELAEVVLEETARDRQTKLAHKHGRPRLASGGPCPFALFGMGKFGGRELGYASDIELLFTYGGPGHSSGRVPLENSEYFERLAQEMMQWIEAKQEGIFHLDVRLRPHGGKSLLANTLEELRTYYSPSGLSAPFERQALIKLRFVSGDEALGRQVEAHRDAFVYSGQPWDLKVALDLRHRQVKELVQPGDTNVKFSPGGLIDVEYAIQYLQLMHGHKEPRLRSPNSLEALAALGVAGLLKPDEGSRLRDAYLFLRGLIDALRIVRGNARDLVLPPPDSDAFIFLSRRLGYTTERWDEGARRLSADISRHMTQTQEFFTARFGPL